MGTEPLFADRLDAGRRLAAVLESERSSALVVVGLARGGVETAAEVARSLDARLDVIAVRKVGHPLQPEYGIGAVTPGDGVYLRGRDGLSDEELADAVERAEAKAELLDRRLHQEHPAVRLSGKPVVIVDDGLATGATMIAALRWARASGADRVVSAVPVAAAASLGLVAREADEVFCLHALKNFFAVGTWYESFPQVTDDAVLRLLGENRQAHLDAPPTWVPTP